MWLGKRFISMNMVQLYIRLTTKRATYYEPAINKQDVYWDNSINLDEYNTYYYNFYSQGSNIMQKL